jgi:dolichol-phosphate mannosyltransferase
MNNAGPQPNQIPIDDPQAALRFCQGLAALLIGSTAAPDTALLPEISIVIPVYNEAENLPTLHQRLHQAMGEHTPNFEIVFVNDGSHDGSLSYLEQLASQDSQVTIIDLARNFGHQTAISAGLDFARGKAVIIMDADLQDPPEVLPLFIDKWRQGFEVVYAIRAKRKESWLKRSAYALFYRILQRVANIEIPLDAGDFCIMDRCVVDLLNGMPERSRFVRGLRSWVGLRQTGLAYERQARYAGHPKFTFTRLVYLALDGLVAFSFLPLRLITLLGFGVSAVAGVLAIYYAIKRLTVGLYPPGFATTIVAILILAGLQLITTGVIGEYVGRTYEEVKRRPLYILRRVVRGK